MIEKLPEDSSHEDWSFFVLDRNVFTLAKINELIDKVNALEKAVKQCDRPIDWEI